MPKKLKNGLIIAYIPVFIICLALNVWLLFYEMALKDSVALQTGYVDAMAYSGEEEKFFIEVEYFPNEYGVKLNYYTDTNAPEKNEDGSYGKKYTYSTGVQFENGATYEVSDTLGWWASWKKIKLTNAYYYNSTDSGVSFGAMSDFTDQEHWVYDINGQLVLIKEIGNQSSSGALGWQTHYEHNTEMMVVDLYDSIKSLEDGVHIVTFDLSQYYTFSLFNGSSGKFDEAIQDENVLEKYMFVNVKVTKSSNDFVSANQSVLFGKFMGDADWTLYDFEKADYWRARNEYNFTIKDFTFTYENNAYYLRLQSHVAEFFSVFKNMKYVVTIDLDNVYLGAEKIYISGFSKKAFGSLGIDEINLTSNQVRTFEVYHNYNINCPENMSISLIGGAT